MTRVPVAYASKHGATADVAAAIGRELALWCEPATIAADLEPAGTAAR
jgi:menaquinone-dependent protoporphyrinogen IX oxidase